MLTRRRSPEWICRRSLAGSSRNRTATSFGKGSGALAGAHGTEVAGLIGADRHERTPERTGHRNGYRMRTWDTRVRTIGLAIPKVRPGTYFPSLLQPRRRAEHALLAVVQEAYVHGSRPGKSMS